MNNIIKKVNRISIITKIKSYFVPQKFTHYRHNDIYIKSTIFGERFLYRSLIVCDTSIYNNHVFEFIDTGIDYNRMIENITLSRALYNSCFYIQKPNINDILLANVGPTYLSNILYKYYYKMLKNLG